MAAEAMMLRVARRRLVGYLTFMPLKGVPGELQPVVKEASTRTCSTRTRAPGLQTRQCGPLDVQLAHLEY